MLLDVFCRMNGCPLIRSRVSHRADEHVRITPLHSRSGVTNPKGRLSRADFTLSSTSVLSAYLLCTYEQICIIPRNDSTSIRKQMRLPSGRNLEDLTTRKVELQFGKFAERLPRSSLVVFPCGVIPCVFLRSLSSLTQPPPSPPLLPPSLTMHGFKKVKNIRKSGARISNIGRPGLRFVSSHDTYSFSTGQLVLEDRSVAAIDEQPGCAASLCHPTPATLPPSPSTPDVSALPPPLEELPVPGEDHIPLGAGSDTSLQDVAGPSLFLEMRSAGDDSLPSASASTPTHPSIPPADVDTLRAPSNAKVWLTTCSSSCSTIIHASLEKRWCSTSRMGTPVPPVAGRDAAYKMPPSHSQQRLPVLWSGQQRDCIVSRMFR